jgi:putative RecB family exonuclease
MSQGPCILLDMDTTAATMPPTDPEATPASPRTRWHSVSSTREYEGCPRRYRFGYLDRRPEDRPVPVSWRFGSAVHAGLEAAYRRRLDDANGGIVESLRAATAAVDGCWAELGLDADADDQGRSRAAWLVGRAVTRDVLAIERILDVEAPLRDRISDQERIIGFADLVLAREGDVVEIVDHKVTRRRVDPEQLRADFQLNLYGQLARLRWPWARAVRATHHYPTGPAAVSVTLDDDAMVGALDRVHRTADVIRRDTEFLPVPGPRCGHCPWQPSCPEGWTVDQATSHPPSTVRH